MMASVFHEDENGTLICGDVFDSLKLIDFKVDMCITSPPYWALRNYHVEGQLGQEGSFKEYINKLCDVFDMVKEVLKDDGTLWVNLGDTYYGSNKGSGGKSDKQDSNKGSRFKYNKNNLGSVLENSSDFKKLKELPAKSLCLIPSRFAIEMQNRGWILRNDIIWMKPNKFPESAKDRFTLDYEHLFMFSKQGKYFFKQQKEPAKESSIKRMEYGWNGAVDEGVAWSGNKNYLGTERGKKSIKLGRNKRSVWAINTESKKGLNHFATYPEALIDIPIKAGCKSGGVVLDVFMGSGTTAVVAEKQAKKWIGIELNPEYCSTAIKRITKARDGNKS